MPRVHEGLGLRVGAATEISVWCHSTRYPQPVRVGTFAVPIVAPFMAMTTADTLGTMCTLPHTETIV